MTGRPMTSDQTFGEALSTLIDDVYAEHLYHNRDEAMTIFRRTRDEMFCYSRQLVISSQVMGQLADDVFWEAKDVTYGTFDNCREYGMTVSIAGWTFAVFENRSSDDISIEGCPTSEVMGQGPYSNDDRDYIMSFRFRTPYHEIANVLVEVMKYVRAHKGQVMRLQLPSVAKRAA